jgi:hypothetical protein
MVAAMPASIDETGWPLVVLRWSGKATDADLAKMLEALDRFLDRGRFGLLLDARGAMGLSQ